MGKEKTGHRFGKKKRRDEQIQAIESVTKRYDEFNPKFARTFEDFPLSRRTLDGLLHAGFIEPTDIQRESVGLALRGCDVLGAAMTGSGKTLAFLIPVLEGLWREQWTRFDGLGALIISPTRELAMQIYDVLLKIGTEHDFSAALVVGGTDVNYESKRLAGRNIVVGTPGRLLQHMDENPNFSCDSMKMLIIDEADRLLDMGFEKQLNAIIVNLPDERQTLLFSATQTRSVKDLARLSLKDPVYVSVHEHAKYSTPEQLKQSYVICEEYEKMDILWSFVNKHLQSKILVFMANCKQVRFIYESFRRLRPHTTVLCLHGSMAQMKRVNVYQQFCNKKHALLLATDIAARGLDFPAVDWVFQLDCPPDANEYIHRCGRTARYRRDGKSLLVLTPSQETAMIEDLTSKKIPITKITINPDMLKTIQTKLVTFCTQDAKFKMLAQQAFVAYIRSVFLMSNKNVFDVKQINCEAMAKSYGLAITPRIRFLRKQQAADSGNSASAYSKPPNPVNQIEDSQTLLEIGTERPVQELSGWGKEEEEEDLLVVKERDVFNVADGNAEESDEDKSLADVQPDQPSSSKLSKRKKKPLTREDVAKKMLKKKIVSNKKVVFDEEGNMDKPQVSLVESADTAADGYQIEIAKKMMKEADKIDLQNYRKRIKEKHQEEKRKRKLVEMEKRQKTLKGKTKDAQLVTLGSNVDEPDGSVEESEQESMTSDGESTSADRPRKKSKLSLQHPEEEYSKMDLEDAERLALQLIGV